jgi:hypothetical protein
MYETIEILPQPLSAGVKKKLWLASTHRHIIIPLFFTILKEIK